jgi:hypothetical protein
MFWPYGKGTAGRGVLYMDGRTDFAHRFICSYVHGEPPTPNHETRHLCGNGHLACVTPRHVVWGTSAENAHDRTVHGTQTRGAEHPKAKLTENDVREIRKLLGTMSHGKIARLFRVGRPAIFKISTGLSWKWLK